MFLPGQSIERKRQPLLWKTETKADNNIFGNEQLILLVFCTIIMSTRDSDVDITDIKMVGHAFLSRFRNLHTHCNKNNLEVNKDI